MQPDFQRLNHGGHGPAQISESCRLAGESVTVGGLRLTVASTDERRIRELLVETARQR